MTKIAVGSSIYMDLIFVDNNGVLTDPDLISAEVLVYNTTTQTYVSNATPETFPVTRQSAGLYEGVWSTSTQGRFKVEVTGNYTNPLIEDILYEKYFLIGDVNTLYDLDSSYLITMLGILTPLYVDPEEILHLYPAGDIVEITEIIHRKSLELEDRVGQTNILSLTMTQHDFIIAATMCELSRIYGLTNGGLNGFNSVDSFTLGDLEVQKGAGGGRVSSGSYDIGNALTWCELAGKLKKELLHAEGNFRPVVAGSIYDSPVPTRELTSSD